MKNVSFDYSHASGFIADHEVESMRFTAMNAAEKLKSRKGEGNDFLGWIDLPVAYDKAEFARIKSGRFRCVVGNRNRRIISRSKGSN